MNISVISREVVGSGSSKKLRNSGFIPATVYGCKIAPESIALNLREILKICGNSSFYSKILNFEINGKSVKVLPKLIQYNPVTDVPIHMDFLRIDESNKMKVSVPVKFINSGKSVAIKRGANLNIVSHSVEILVNVNEIPEYLELDLSDAEVGRTFVFSDLIVPEGVAQSSHSSDVIATLVSSRNSDDKEEK